MRREVNQSFQFELSRSDNESGATFSLVVIDTTSGGAVLESEFNAEQFANLMSSRLTSEGIPTWFAEPQYRDRIGKNLGIISRIFSYAETRDENAIADWVDQVHRFMIPCEFADKPRRRGGSGGYIVNFRQHFPTAAEATAWEAKQGQLLADLPSPAQLADGFRFTASLAAYQAETTDTKEN